MNDQKIYVKLLNITITKEMGNANQNNNEISPHTY